MSKGGCFLEGEVLNVRSSKFVNLVEGCTCVPFMISGKISSIFKALWSQTLKKHYGSLKWGSNA